MEFILGLLLECLSPLIWWLVLFPMVWLVSLPFILLLAPFQTAPYGLAVTLLSAAVHDFWKRQGKVFCP